MSEHGFLRRNRTLVIAGSIVAAVAVIVLVTILLSQDGDGPSRQEAGPATSASPNLTGPAEELMRLLEAGTELAFDGRYTVSSNGPAGALRLWSRPPLLRVDTESGSGAQLRRSAQFSMPTGAVACTRQGDGPWTCRSQPNLPIRSGLVPEVFVTQLARSSVEARNDRVGDRDARCFALTTANAGSADVCLTPEGIPLRFQALSTRVEVVQLARSLPPPEIFEPPAPVS
jgi:hypothetical protein